MKKLYGNAIFIASMFIHRFSSRLNKAGNCFEFMVLRHKKILRLTAGILITFYAVTTFAQVPAWQWARCTGSIEQNYSYGLCTDTKGNVYLAASFSGPSITLGGTTLTNNTGNAAALLVKYDPQGNVIWATAAHGYNTGAFNGYISSIPSGVSADRFGNIYVTGSFYGSIVAFGNDTLVNLSAIGSAVFLVKFDSSGNVLWAKTDNGSNSVNAAAVSTDAAGNAYITGIYSDSILFGNNSLHTGRSSAFTVKYDASGQVVWANSPAYVPNSVIAGSGIAADSTGNVYVTGYFQNDSITFDDITVYNPHPGGGYNVYTVKYDTSGHAIWAHAATGDYALAIPSGVAIDRYGNTYITGGYNSPYVIFGRDTLTTDLNTGDIFIVKYDSSGNTTWAQTAEIPNGGSFGGVAVNTDIAGNIYILGTNFHSTEFVFGNDSISLGNQQVTQSFFIVKFDGSGNVIWMKATGESTNSAQGATPSAMCMDNTGAIYVAGNLGSASALIGNDTITAPYGFVYYFIGKLDTPSGSATMITSVQKPANQISVFPNPSPGRFTITNIQPGTSLTITDAVGRQVLVQNLNIQSVAQVDLSNVESGVYFFQFISDVGSTVQKVILSKVR